MTAPHQLVHHQPAGRSCRASAVDARRSALRLTDAGHALRERAVAARLGWLGGVVQDWSEQDVRTLAGALGRFADAVGASPPPGPPQPP